jgi:hypothetical protein
MSRTSFLKHSLGATAAVAILAALLSPANATYRQDAVAVFPDVSISAATGRAPTALTSRLPWLAPVGHRQPHQADVPHHEAVSAWEHQQQQVDRELDRKLIICRGC